MPGTEEREVNLSNLEELRQGASSQPNDLQSQYRYGWALLGLGQAEAARKVFEASRTRWPEEIEILYGLAMAVKAEGKLEKASELFEQVQAKAAEGIRDSMLKRMAGVQIEVILSRQK
jgi:tetratricopeptide (TPR) repeat protein